MREVLLPITDRIHQVSTVRNLTLLLLLTAVTAFIMMGIIQPQMNAISGSAPLLDVRLMYNYDDAMTLFTLLGQDGRQLYSLHQMVDCIFPLAYGFSMALALDLLVAKALQDTKRYGFIVMLPILAIVLDYVENGLVATQIIAFPSLSPEVIGIASLMTLTKWFFILLSFALLILLAISSKTKTRA